jgi:hypothetical protein
MASIEPLVWRQRRAAAERALKAAFGHPALATTAAVGALLGLTWPLLVFDRPLYVVVAFFAIWSLTIGLLYMLSRAPEDDDATNVSDPPPSEDALDRSG